MLPDLQPEDFWAQKKAGADKSGWGERPPSNGDVQIDAAAGSSVSKISSFEQNIADPKFLSFPPPELASEDLEKLLVGRADEVDPARRELANDSVLVMKR